MVWPRRLAVGRKFVGLAADPAEVVQAMEIRVSGIGDGQAKPQA